MPDLLIKEKYIKPEVTSEVIEPGALASYGSPETNLQPEHPWLHFIKNPSCGFCCEEW
jgi:hypothetical protein